MFWLGFFAGIGAVAVVIAWIAALPSGPGWVHYDGPCLGHRRPGWLPEFIGNQVPKITGWCCRERTLRRLVSEGACGGCGEIGLTSRRALRLHAKQVHH